MQCTVLRSGTTLVVSIKITKPTTNQWITQVLSKENSVSDAVVVQFKHVTYRNYSNGYYNDNRNLDFVSLTKKDQSDPSSYTVNMSSPELKMDDTFEADNSYWRLIKETTDSEYSFTITIKIESFKQLNPFAELCDDTNLTDFTLKCDDGSIAIHKTVLAAVSTYFRSKIAEVDESGSLITTMFIPDTSMNTLEDFKKALYVNILPEKNLESLILIASFFKLKTLELKCVDKLLFTLKSTDAINLLEFALKNRIMTIFLGILDQVQSGDLKMGEIRKVYLNQ